MKDRKAIVKIYIFALVISLGLILLVCGLNGLLTEDKSPQDTAKICCDAFFVSATCMLGFGALSWSSTKGAFDGLGYSVSSMINVHRPSKARLNWEKNETYEEYVERKHKKDKDKRFMHMIYIGTLWLVIAIICLVVYHSY